MEKIAIIGLGYVGLPLAVEFARKYSVIGFDISDARIKELKDGKDHTLEVETSTLKQVSILYSNKLDDLKQANYYIITVPTPIDDARKPDLGPILRASETVGKVLKPGDIVIYESTVYPGCTEEDCVPVLEKHSGLKFNRDFFCGYSPERVNPGDKEHTIPKIKKVTSGSKPEVADKVDRLYASIITAGTHKAPSIKVAEAAKVIENSQRDINIAFMNELSLIFERMDLDTSEVLTAAGTKWNFLRFTPGLVGGHCIGVDPYYLTYKAEKLGYHPQVILAGRRINDGMGAHVASQLVKTMIKKEISIKGARVLILGMTFKENCPDTRNSKVVDIISELNSFGCKTHIYDPWADKDQAFEEYGLKLEEESILKDILNFEAIVVAVAHKQFKEIDFSRLKSPKRVIFDVKSILPKELVDRRL